MRHAAGIITFMTADANSPTIRDLIAAGGFHTTRWTQVVRAKERTDEGGEALRGLCEAYYSPVIAFLRRRSHGPDEARDLAHEFFEGVLEGDAIGGAEQVRGRFRSYLLGAVKHFLSHQREAQQRQRRGGGQKSLSLDVEDENGTTLAIADDGSLSPDAAFDRQWALTTLDHALQALRKECEQEGRERMFDLLQPQLTGDAEHGDQAALAESLGMNLNSLKSAVLRLKRRFRGLVKAHIAVTLDDDSAVEEEMASLYAALRAC
jgi:RNA polymerase sigma-70 factor (ECF subfamily)